MITNIVVNLRIGRITYTQGSKRDAPNQVLNKSLHMIIKLRHWRHGAYPLCNNQVALIYNIPLSFQRISLTDASLAMKSARSMIIMIRLNYNPLSKQCWETLMLTRASIARYLTQAKKIDLLKIPRVAVGPAWGVFAKVNVPRRPH